MKVKTYRDPLVLAIDVTQQRVKALILWEMEKKKQELSSLVHNIPSLDSRIIFEELNELIELGLVSRVVHVKRKPQQIIEYALTNRGAQLLKCLRKMMNVGIEIMMDYGMNEYLMEEGYIERVDLVEDDLLPCSV
ncbi:winged helix-turn-helix transcriptional regulator [Amedibacillus sp. YH-ame6]